MKNTLHKISITNLLSHNTINYHNNNLIKIQSPYNNKLKIIINLRILKMIFMISFRILLNNKANNSIKIQKK